MLQTLKLNHFVIARDIDFGLASGLCIITGKTGAGKSILISALSLLMGGRIEKRYILKGADRAQIMAYFDPNDAASQWLRAHGLDQEEGGCIIRRIIKNDNTSKSWINDHPVTLKSLQELGSFLVSIYGQHQHQRLLERDQQRQLIDRIAANQSRIKELEQLYEKDHALKQEISNLKKEQFSDSQLNALRFQLEEFDAIEDVLDTYQELDQRLAQLQHVQELGTGLSASIDGLFEADQGNLLLDLENQIKELGRMRMWSDHLGEPIGLLEQASVYLKEARSSLIRLRDDLPSDDREYRSIEEKLGQIHAMARKHHCRPEELKLKKDGLSAELKRMEGRDRLLEELSEKRKQLHADYGKIAAEVTKNRQAVIERLNRDVSAYLDGLGMPQARLCVTLNAHDKDHLTRYGFEQVEFLVVTNPGQKPLPMKQIASGGELSRIGLAIQMVTQAKSGVPTLIFDEVDSGVSGKVAHNVGASLAKVAEHAQVLCITHLPQVAAHADVHYRIQKDDSSKVEFSVHCLSEDERIEELSALLEGTKVTESTRRLARELVSQAKGI